MSQEKSDAPSSQDIDFTLKQLDKWVKRIRIIGGLLGLALTAMSIWNLSNQRGLQNAQQQLLVHQATAEAEKQRVNVSMELKAFNAPMKNRVYVTSTLTNHSARQVNMAMVGIRIWNQNWHSDIEIRVAGPFLFCFRPLVGEMLPPNAIRHSPPKLHTAESRTS